MQTEPFLSGTRETPAPPHSAFQTHVSKNCKGTKTQTQTVTIPPPGTEGNAMFVSWLVSFSLGQCTIPGLSELTNICIKKQTPGQAHNTYWGGHSQANISMCLCFSALAAALAPRAGGTRSQGSIHFLFAPLFPTSLSERSTWAQPPTWAKPVLAEPQPEHKAALWLCSPHLHHWGGQGFLPAACWKSHPQKQLITLSATAKHSPHPWPNQLLSRNLQTSLQAALKSSTLNKQVSNQ